jgi:TonB family protein
LRSRFTNHYVRFLRILLLIISCALGLMLPAKALPSADHVESNDGGRKIKTRVEPEYPVLAKKMGIRGTARIEITVTPDGVVKEVHELGGNPVLLDALVRAVKQWKYEPAARESVIEVKASFGQN